MPSFKRRTDRVVAGRQYFVAEWFAAQMLQCWWRQRRRRAAVRSSRRVCSPDSSNIKIMVEATTVNV